MKLPGMLMRGDIVLHDNASPHVACTVQNMLHSMCTKLLDHTLFSLDLSPRDFHVFSPLKKVLKCHTFESERDAGVSMAQWLQQQPREFFAELIH
jgi:hypothetical protein